MAGALGVAVGSVFADERGFDFRPSALGAALAIPVGVHLSNRTRGNLLLATVASAGIGTAVAYGGLVEPVEWKILLVAAPVAELAASVWIERFTAKRRRVTGTIPGPLSPGSRSY